jgi:hypothetical protein
MKPICAYLNLVCLILVFFFNSACTKNNQGPGNDNNLSKLRPSDSLISVKSGISDVSDVQAIFKESATNLDCFFYGERNSDKQITKITAAAIKKYNSADTVLNILFDNDQRVKVMYFTLYGKNDKTYVTLDYLQDTVVVNVNNMNWETGAFSLVGKTKVKKDGTKYKLASIGKISTNSFIPNYVEANIIANAAGIIIGANAIIIGGSTILGFVIGGPWGGAAGFFIGAKLAGKEFSIKSAGASEVTYPLSYYPYNPVKEKYAIIPYNNNIVLTGTTSQFVIGTISQDDVATHYFQFAGTWAHYLLGTQDALGNIVSPGSVVGNMKILLSVQSLTDGAVLQETYYDGTPIKVTAKNVKVVCGPRDINSKQRFSDGHIPAADMRMVNMVAVSYLSK